jgi:hypothetical protein
VIEQSVEISILDGFNKMKRIIFYSWQSDLPNKTNRGFIETALLRSLKNILNDGSELIRPVLDRDTDGEIGTPQITDSIFAKITMADIFVCDVSIINKDEIGKPTPNPNVLIELGYAIATLGWNRILLIQNNVYGGPEKLPFDLRGRRIIGYSQREDELERAAERNNLTGKLEVFLKQALYFLPDANRHAGPHVPIWWGRWNTLDDGRSSGGSLFIYEVGPSGFLFDLVVSNGSHSGTISGYARIVSSDLAYFRKENDINGCICEISIRRRISEDTQIIEIIETGDCQYWRGVGAFFSGTFLRRVDRLFETGVLDEMDLARLYRLLGEHYENFRNSFQGINPIENIDNFCATCFAGGVRGLYTSIEGIIMRGEKGELWAAFIDDDVVRYFTTEEAFKNVFPETFDLWRKNFSEKDVIFSGHMDYIPKFP